MAKAVFVFGNPIVEEDSIALKVAERLKGKVKEIEFRLLEGPEELPEGEDLYIMDAALGIEKVEVLQGLDSLKSGKIFSGHDFDLAMELKVLEKAGRIGEVKIIAIPMDYGLRKAAREVKRILT